ncbi:hypothetical protein CKO15_11690 [Halorhodospira abdelmalekii]|uniref:DNA-J related domain-containing protein n=1 Tax=Halorhodospira abdelmalekii TaxID=421629 RepID=UPI00190898E1|nr:DNA-J related domain-containing protein [Halorhodospira abdelmalekii]MBK1735927.1 hypothetical protein [Halorhodospira abdelmalekii]
MEFEKAIATLQHHALRILRAAQPHGLDEWTLMEALAEAGCRLFERAARQRPETLFRAHFILFHALYRVRPQLAAEGLTLQIHCLDIRLCPHPQPHAQSGALAAGDEVAAFYLDLSNLEGMDDTAVEALIAEGLRRCLTDDLANDPDHRHEALAVLGLEADADRVQIRRAYRRLAMRHHPDRGGDTATLQRITAAYRQLTGN